MSFHWVAALWRENKLKSHRQGTFKVSKDPRFAEKVADIVGLYLDPSGAAVALSIDEKTRAPRGAGVTGYPGEAPRRHRHPRFLRKDIAAVRGRQGDLR